MSALISRLLPAWFATLPLLAAASAEELPLADISHIHGIGFDPSAPGSILLATHFGIYRASPAGIAETVSQDASDYMGFSPDPGDPGRLLASGHPEQGGNLGVILSTDGGNTWSKIADGVSGPVDFHALTISRADPQVMYGLYGGIQMSRDGGATWSMVGPGPDKVIDLAAYSADPDTVFAGTVSGLMQSDNAGVTWALVGASGPAATMVEATGDGSLYVFFAGTGLFRLLEDGRWIELASDFGERYILHLAADPADAAHLVAVTDESAVLESRDGGKSWAEFAR